MNRMTIRGKMMSEDLDYGEAETRDLLAGYLEKEGWTIPHHEIKSHGVDIEAKNGKQRWLIEVKGCGSRTAMRHNYFLAIIGEILQRMEHSTDKYSIAFPNRKKYLDLWQKLPLLAKERSKISMILVGKSGYIEYQ